MLLSTLWTDVNCQSSAAPLCTVLPSSLVARFLFQPGTRCRDPSLSEDTFSRSLKTYLSCLPCIRARSTLEALLNLLLTITYLLTIGHRDLGLALSQIQMGYVSHESLCNLSFFMEELQIV